MTPRLVFWALSLFNLAAVVGAALVGFQSIRSGAVERHRRFMDLSGRLILAFLVAYLLKVVFLGKEDLATWSAADVTVLRVHECIVLLMLVTGGGARFLAYRSGGAVPARHRLLGRVALVASVGALLTATAIFYGMVTRSSSPESHASQRITSGRSTSRNTSSLDGSG